MKNATKLLLAVLVVCPMIHATVTAEEGQNKHPTEEINKYSKMEKKYNTYEFKAKTPAFELFLIQRQIDYVNHQIQTVDEWIPKLKITEPNIDPKKILSELREKQSALERKLNKYEEETPKDMLIFQKPYIEKGYMMIKNRNKLHDILSQIATQRESALREPCPSDFYMYGSIPATEFKEYIHDSGTNDDSKWSFMRGGSESTIIEADALRFDAYAFPIPQLGLDEINSIWTAGLLKFNFPVAPCDVVIEWNAVVNIDLILGAIISEKNDGIMIDLILREQPDSTSFPDVGLDDPSFEWVELLLDFCHQDHPNCPSGLNNRQRQTRRIRLSGQFQVESGMTSSLIMGPALYVMGWSEWASIGRMDNPWDDGSFFLHGMGDDCYYGIPCGWPDLSIEYLMRPQ